jgi:hypothetical protein
METPIEQVNLLRRHMLQFSWLDVHQCYCSLCIVNTGEFLLKAAKELHTEDPQRARELYLKGVRYYPVLSD